MKLKIKRTGEIVTVKQFYSRWKEGMERVTPLQQTQVNQFGFITIFIGVIWGIIFSIKLKQWWLSIILTGSLIVSSTSFLGNWQKKTVLKRIDKIMKEDLFPYGTNMEDVKNLSKNGL